MSSTENKTTGFQIMATGQVESGDFGGVDNLYCKYSYLIGKDWRIIQVRAGVAARFVVVVSLFKCVALSLLCFCRLRPPPPQTHLPPFLRLSAPQLMHLRYTILSRSPIRRIFLGFYAPFASPRMVYANTARTPTRVLTLGSLKLRARTMPGSRSWCGTFQ